MQTPAWLTYPGWGMQVWGPLGRSPWVGSSQSTTQALLCELVFSKMHNSLLGEKKSGVSGFPEEAGDSWVFPPAFGWREAGTPEPCGGPGGRDHLVLPKYLTHTHGWVGSNLNPNLQISKNQGEFLQTRKLDFQPAGSPRVSQLIKGKARVGIRKTLSKLQNQQKKPPLPGWWGNRRLI